MCVVWKRFEHSWCRQRIACDADTLAEFVSALHTSEVGTESSFLLPKLGGSCMNFSFADLLRTEVFQGHHMRSSLAADVYIASGTSKCP